jgi:thiamine phosphate synthase YjbQ (UPF0047 family)
VTVCKQALILDSTVCSNIPHLITIVVFAETVQHTSASLTINENYDSDVLDDVETWLTGTVPEVLKFLPCSIRRSK